MIFFTADLHFGHENIITLCGRPYGSLEEMNEVLIAKWNAKVSGGDSVYILGDLFFREHDPRAIETILKRLKGRKHLIVGNHDGSWMRLVDTKRFFVSVNHYLEVSAGGVGMTLCHYPLLIWNHAARTYMIHGHIHQKRSMDFWPALQARPRVLNAGVDINFFAPVSFAELQANNARWKGLDRPDAAADEA